MVKAFSDSVESKHDRLNRSANPTCPQTWIDCDEIASYQLALLLTGFFGRMSNECKRPPETSPKDRRES